MIRVFTKRTKWTPIDENVFIGDPPFEFMRPPAQNINISVTFTWDIKEGRRLLKEWSKFYSNVQIGGPAFGDPGDEFIPGRYLKKGITITSRGCPHSCKYCYVPNREGKIRELNIPDGYILQDNNILACSDPHIDRVFSMLKRQNRGVVFSGGLDPLLFSEKHLRLLENIKIKELWFSCDSLGSLKSLTNTSKLIEDISVDKKRCYILMGFNGETLIQAQRRVEKVYELEFLPFAQLYRGDEALHYSKEWNALARKWSRPAIYRA